MANNAIQTEAEIAKQVEIIEQLYDDHFNEQLTAQQSGQEPVEPSACTSKDKLSIRFC